MSQANAASPRRNLSPARIATSIVVLIGVVLFASAGFYTDVLWYNQLGYSEVLFNRIFAQATLFAITAITGGGLLGLSIWIAWRTRPVYVKFAADNEVLGQVREAFNQLRKGLLIAIPVGFGVLSGLAGASYWDTALLFLNGVQ